MLQPINEIHAKAIASQQENIDRELVALLGQKIALLRQAKSEENAEIAELLAQFNVPEFVWNDLTLSCKAASTIACSPVATRSRQITIIGGSGKMGSLFAQQLAIAGHQISILSRNDWENAAKLLGKADLVVLCVPIKETIKTIKKAAPYLSESTILVDLTSVKAGIVSAMLESHQGPVVSLHPMFGPGVRSFLSQNFTVCHGRSTEAYQWFLDFLESKGGKLVFCTPQEHDRMMESVQAIRHFVTFSLGVFLCQEEIDLDRSLKFTSPLYRLQLDLVNRLFAQDSSLSLHLMLSSEERRQAIGRLASTYWRLALAVSKDDRATLFKEFEATRDFFQERRDSSLQETDRIIESLGVFLATQALENKQFSSHGDRDRLVVRSLTKENAVRVPLDSSFFSSVKTVKDSKSSQLNKNEKVSAQE
jgi:prephenate dehydrogenase